MPDLLKSLSNSVGAIAHCFNSGIECGTNPIRLTVVDPDQQGPEEPDRALVVVPLSDLGLSGHRVPLL